MGRFSLCKNKVENADATKSSSFYSSTSSSSSNSKQPDEGVFDLPEDFADRIISAGICTSPQEAEQVLQGYRDFMCLKRRFQDWRGTTLKPSRKIQAVWQQHILFMKHYQKACLEYHGRLVEYNPDEEDDSITYERKRQGTLFALTALCGAQEIDTFSWGSLVKGTNKPMSSPKNKENNPNTNTGTGTTVNGEKIRIFEATSSSKKQANNNTESTETFVNNPEDAPTTSSLCCF